MTRAGGGASWIEELYDRHAASLFRYAAMLLADRALAADAVHQVFAKVIAQADGKPDQEASYLRRAVRNECFSFLRASRRNAVVPDSEPFLVALRATDERPDERLAIEAALRQLPPEQREVVHLKIFEGMTFREIADLADESVNTIGSRYRYAVEKLRTLLHD